MTVSIRFGALDILKDPEEVLNTYKRETPEGAKEWIGERPKSQSGFTSLSINNHEV